MSPAPDGSTPVGGIFGSCVQREEADTSVKFIYIWGPNLVTADAEIFLSHLIELN